VFVRELGRVNWWWKRAGHAIYGPICAWAVFELFVLVVQVLPPAGETAPNFDQIQWWIMFGALTVYVAQFAIYHTIRSIQRLRLQEEQASNLEALARESELTALKAQINPHFLFNTLHAISTLVTRDPDGVQRMIARLSTLLRYALESTSTQEVTLGREMEFLEDYLEIQRIRFEDRLEVNVDVDPAIVDAQVPSLVLQPLVENAVKHGASNAKGVGRVEIQARREGAELVLEVRDNGPGLEEGEIEEELTDEEVSELKREAKERVENLRFVDDWRVLYQRRQDVRQIGMVLRTELDRLATRPGKGRYLGMILLDEEGDLISEKFITNPAIKHDRGRDALALNVLKNNGVGHILLAEPPDRLLRTSLSEMGLRYAVPVEDSLEFIKQQSSELSFQSP
jgi:two-component sensor histidine kinase